jgi:hypothetical protein
MGKRARHDGDEQDAFSPKWRRWIGLDRRAGVIKKTKRRANKRDRKIGVIDSVIEDEYGIIIRGRIEP